MNKEKVIETKCASYNQSLVNSSIADFLAQLNVRQTLVKPGQTVLLKPNMLSCKSPERAATTHPSIVQSVAEYFVKAGARVLIGDSPPAVTAKCPVDAIEARKSPLLNLVFRLKRVK